MFTTLRARIFAGFGAVVAITLVFTLWAVYEFSGFGDVAVATMQDAAESTARLNELERALASQSLALVASTSDTAMRSRARIAERDFDSTLGLLRTSSDTGMSEHTVAISTARSEYDSVASRILRTSNGLQPETVSRLLTQFENVLRRIETARNIVAEGTTYSSRIRSQLRTTLFRISAAIVLASLLGLIGANLYSKWAVKSIDRLRQAVRQVGRGEFAHTVRITTDDELGDLSREFNRMIEQLRRYEGMNLERILLEQRKAEMIVSSITTPIFVVDSELSIVLANSSAKRLFRHPIHVDFTGRPVGDLTHDSQVVQTIRRHIAPDRNEERAYQTATWTTEVEGEEKHYSLQVFPLQSRQTTGGAIAVFADITELKELDRLKDDLIARLSHEFRTPVSSLLMGLDLLDQQSIGTLTRKQQEIVSGAKADCRRISAMVQDILDFVQVEGISIDASTRRSSLDAVLSDALETHRRTAERSGKSLQTNLTSDVASAIVDETVVRLIVDNLISNALRHTGRGDVVTIESHRDRGDLVLTVTDTGTGIPADSLDKIFEKFYQVDTGEAPAPGSIGLGLAIVKEAVRKASGTIGVRSTLNEGTTFTVRLPSIESPDRSDTDQSVTGDTA